MPATTQALSAENPWQKTLSFLLRRRVPITSFLFIALVVEDLINGTNPHSLMNLRDYHVLLGLGLVFAGLGLRSWAAGTIHKRTELTTSGPYGLVRHPLYIGSLMLMLGFCTLVNDRENIWFVLGPILLLYIWRAITEERYLSAAFPDQWPTYARNVPRFVPRRLPMELFRSWRLEQWLNNREYQAVSAVLLGLVALQAWHVVVERIAHG
jgi:protein-S-isoprenylcysteine O-methyltransferase Ste14